MHPGLRADRRRDRAGLRVLLTQLTSTSGPITVASHAAFQLIMAIAAVACLVALAVAAFLPGREAVEAAKAAKETPQRVTAGVGRA